MEENVKEKAREKATLPKERTPPRPASQPAKPRVHITPRTVTATHRPINATFGSKPSTPAAAALATADSAPASTAAFVAAAATAAAAAAAAASLSAVNVVVVADETGKGQGRRAPRLS